MQIVYRPTRPAQLPTPSLVKERRASPRIEFTQFVVCQNRNEHILARGVDLGAGGLALTSSLIPRLGAVYELAFALPGDPTLLRTSATVLRSRSDRPPRTTWIVALNDATIAVRETLAKYVERHGLLHGQA